MRVQSTLTNKIQLRKQNKQIGLIPFLTAGIPNKEIFWNCIVELAENGADIIEIGVPFSDPVADGEVVAQASAKALENGIGLTYILQGLHQHKPRLSKSSIVLMGYANPFLQHAWPASEESTLTHIEEKTKISLEKLASDLEAAGVEGLIIPDLPLQEWGIWQSVLQSKGISLIALVGVNTPKERMQEYAKVASGYVYIVSVLGITGARASFPVELSQTIQDARQTFDLPLALGFGLAHPEQLANFAKTDLPDAVVFGSALIKHLSSGGSAKEFLTPWNAQ